MASWQFDNNQIDNMSSNARARRNRGERKEFLEKDDNDNVIGVLDEDPLKNKIEEKQEDMFDPHQLKQNIFRESLQDTHTTNLQTALIDFDDDTLEPPLKEYNLSGKKKEEETARKQRKRERGKREAKKYGSEEQNDQLQEKQEKPQPSIFEGQPQELLEDQEIEMPNPSKAEEQAREEQEARLQAEKMRQMVSKKTSSSTDNYVLMHSLLNKAGSNKQERRNAVYVPLEPGQHSFVYFKRYQSGFSEYYQVIGQDQRPIFFCENQRGCIGCNYYISLTKEMDKSNPAYLGKLRGNATGSIYQLYDRGIQPNSDYDRFKFRVRMAFIEYESNFLGMKGPRKLRVVIPKVTSLQDFDMFKFSEQESLDTLQGNVIRLRNKQPRWNQRLKSYALNFGGRVKQASIKNFILTEEKFDLEQEDKAPNAIVFGKIEESTFALEFAHPLSLFQAFGIAMSEFDFKLKCE